MSAHESSGRSASDLPAPPRGPAPGAEVGDMVQVDPTHLVPEKYLTPAERTKLGMPKITASDVRAALEARYERQSQGRVNEKWILIPEARSGAGFQGNNGSCDLLAINTWPSQGLQVIGHEVKVSYSDWQNELTNPDKAERFARFCHRWWIVAPGHLAKRIKDELPDTWGLLAVSDTGRIREMVSAPRRTPDPIPEWWWIGWMAQLDRMEKRQFTQKVNAEIAARVNEAIEAERRRTPLTDMTAQDVLDLRNLRSMKERVDEFQREFGINITRAWGNDFKKLGVLWKHRHLLNLGSLARQLQQAGKALEELTDAES